VTYSGTPGKRDEVRVLPHPTGVRIVSKGIAAGPFCFTVNEHDARCGPPAPEGLLMVARTGDGPYIGFTHIGRLMLGSGKDFGIAYAASVFGGPGDDEVWSFDPDRDSVDCGTGRDRAYVSPNDRVTHCETITSGSPD
jgi:hypothetical protein